MAFSHYLDVVIRMPEVANELHGRLLYLVHTTIRNQSSQLAASWPDMKYDGFGFVFRVFGSPTSLAGYAQACQPMIERGLVRLYPVSEIPPHAVHDHHFARDRNAEKNTPGFQARLQARCARRGVQQHQPRTANHDRRPLFLFMQSGSTGQGYSLHIKRATGPAPQGAGGNNYGLGLTIPSF